MAGQNQWQPGMTSDVFIPDQLISGPLQVVTDGLATIAKAAAALKRGTIMGKVTATGAYIKCVKTASDGSQIPVAILVDDIDTTAADKRGGVYLMGEFNERSIIFDASWTLEGLRTAMRSVSIFIRQSSSGAPITQ